MKNGQNFIKNILGTNGMGKTKDWASSRLESTRVDSLAQTAWFVDVDKHLNFSDMMDKWWINDKQWIQMREVMMFGSQPSWLIVISGL